MRQKKAFNGGIIFLEIGIILFFALLFFINIFRFNYNMNADIAAEALLARTIWSSKELIPSTWLRSSETRVMSTPNFAALFYGLTGNMVISEGLACCLMIVWILLSIVYFSKKAELSRVERDLLLLLGGALPANMAILELIYLFACYYAIHVAVLFFTLGVYVESLKKRKIKLIAASLGVVFALFLGIQGMRGILVLYGPLFGIEIIRIAYRFYCKEKNKKEEWAISIWVCVLLAMSFIGTCFPFSEGQEFSRNIRKGLSKLVTVVLPNIKKAIGFDKAGIYGKVFLAVLVVIILYELIMLLCRMWKRESIEAISWAFLVICASPVVTAFIVSFTTFNDSERYYFLLIYAMALAVVLLWRKMSNKWKTVGGILITIFVLINVYTVYFPILKSKEPPETDAYAVGKYLEENDYHVAYSTFENANRITVLTNGRVQVSAVSSVDKMSICKWLTSTEWYVPNRPFKEKTAYIIPEAEMERFGEFLREHEEEMYFAQEIGDYSIYVSDYNFSVLE